MNYKTKIIKKEEYSVSKWSGGQTTELYIYPEDSKYKDRNFMWRISSATMDVQESTFTYLPGFSRELMVIHGETTLEHESRYKVTLKPFEKDSFMGDWTTKSFGKASDFNLMTSQDCNGSLDVLDVKDKISIELNCTENGFNVSQYFYPVGGSIEVQIKDDKFHVDERDLFVISYSDWEEEINIVNNSSNEIKIITAMVKCGI
ncbi:HutD family protein [Clostridium guangxiense]|uniref:HutD family protein n=1 Tax=Clostridium guangxiense TaxID=1662055 RepID=UPI001E3F467C|nr:HutD family protein [Clostridium guangxiense]MCD2346959.1 HutD family protein [Clostridium guangxiense]